MYNHQLISRQEQPSEVRELITTNGNTGYNAATGQTEDLVKAGVIDPAVFSCRS